MSKELVKWVKEELVPHILKNEDVRGAKINKTEVRSMDSMKDNWASSMFEINLLLDDVDKKSLPLLLKVMNDDANVREKMQSHKQFFNEIHLYSAVLPQFTSQVNSQQLKSDFENLFPKCYYSYFDKNKKPESHADASIVMENLKVRDFKLGNRTALDYKHCSLALKCLGVYHAFSYFMKTQDPDAFQKLVKPIQETNYDPKDKQTWNAVFGVSEKRVIDGLASEIENNSNETDKIVLDRLQELAARNPFDVFVDLAKPKEPLAVLCHGDFLRNNVLFRYEDGEPVEMKFIDFQTIRYASPAIDVSLLICMNTTHELRVAHFDELLREYHSSLTETLSVLLGKQKDKLDRRYSYESFLNDFRKHAIYGYMITIEFLPWMFADDEELEAFVKVYWEARASAKHLELARDLGGEKATRELVVLAKDLFENKCL